MRTGHRWLLLLAALTFLTLILCFASCRGDDDDNDDNDAGIEDDDNDDNDAAGDDDNDDNNTGGQCEGYDLTVEGVTHSPSGDQTWKAYLNIDIPTGAITGLIDPEDEEMDTYEVTGFRHDSQSGEVEGSFPTPSTIPAALCEAETVFNHMDFVIVAGNMTGNVTFYCGEISTETELFTLNADGEVTCGNFAM